MQCGIRIIRQCLLLLLETGVCQGQMCSNLGLLVDFRIRIFRHCLQLLLRSGASAVAETSSAVPETSSPSLMPTFYPNRL